jgi:hypothetical protein
MLKLALALSQPIEYIESLDLDTLNEFKALNIISPFTHDAQAWREGLMATLIYNNNVTKKKDLKKVSDLFPYLDPSTPDYLEDEIVLKCRKALTACNTGGMVNESMYKDVLAAINVEIEEARNRDVPDQYRISELRKLIPKDKTNV